MDGLREQVRRRYAQAAMADCSCETGCCGSGAGTQTQDGRFGRVLYGPDLIELPIGAVEASLGCGNPTVLAEPRPGEVVLDLGSGAGLDALLSARQVGPTGTVYGLDMTDEMLERARANVAAAGATNVRFLKGYIEDVPLPDAAVDVVISNCVINLSTDKPALFAELGRVVRPGGRIAISDVVADDTLSVEQRAERGSYVGCIAGALSFREYRDGLAAVGFQDVDIAPTHPVADGMYAAAIRATRIPAPTWNR